MNFKRRFVIEDEFIPLASTADIMFLLMIFFLVTTTFTNMEKGINMQLPDTVVQEEIPAENVSISVDDQNRIYLDGKEIKLEEVAPMVKQRLAGHPERYVLIKSDKGIKYGRVVDILDELFGAGIHNIALPTKKETVGGKTPGGA